MAFQSMAPVVFSRYLTVRARRTVMSTAFAALLIWQAAALYTSPAHAAENSLADFPLVVHCEGNRVLHFYYLSKINPDGIAVYLTPGRQGGTISIDGAAKRVVEGVTGTCSGKTLEQIRSAGQAYECSPPRIE